MYRKINYNIFNNISYSKLHTCRINLSKYSDTIILPKTKFPQKLVGKKISERNKYVHENCGFTDLYSWQKSNLQNNEFILHDGPPYANGMPHMGHAVNKILKDIINRYNLLCGKKINYIPGWDCHGLPIELKASSKMKKCGNTPLEIRATAREFAKNTVETQKQIFESWGIMADWKNYYATYNISYIKNQLQQFYKLYSKKLIYRDVKPVYWSPSSRTALAEAELEYNDKHKSTAIVIRFKLSEIPSELKKFINTDLPLYALIWTTTPWTLPSNQAICYNPDLFYSFVKSADDSAVYLIATDLLQNISKVLQKDFQIISTFKGNVLANVTYCYPFKNNEFLPFLAGKHATATKGTGLVHTAPAHGPDDFVLALDNKIPVKCIVNESGCYTQDSEVFKGLFVLKEGNEAVIKHLKDDILNVEDYIHSYPYDWRTKKPVILRASQQWFVDTNSIKNRAIELLENVKICPEKNSVIYKNTFITQLKKRPYWCISRQRVWGVPIPVFYNKNTKQPIISQPLIDHLCQLLDKHGIDYWWNLSTELLFPQKLLDEYNLSINEIEKGQDILDIWFDSGISWSSVLGENKIADLYLEGVDQFTGWFQSSLLTSVALRDKVPYKKVFVHGFAVDENGHKMSKSLGNVVDPQKIINGGKQQPALGIDTLRWWVACHASQNSTAFVTQNVLQSSVDEVQKIRNTLRFAVGALHDDTNNFQEFSSLQIIDKYLLHLLYEFDTQIKEMYNEYQFNLLCITVINFITNPVSALYYTTIKDRLYCNAANDFQRMSSLFVLNKILNIISKAIAPILPHLVEELFFYKSWKQNETFFKSPVENISQEFYQPTLENIMETVLNIKRDLNKQNNYILDLNVEIDVSNDLFEKLQIFQDKNKKYPELVDIFQVSDVVIKKSERTEENYIISTYKTDKNLCLRCRKFSSINKEELCKRCSKVIGLKNKLVMSV